MIHKILSNNILSAVIFAVIVIALCVLLLRVYQPTMDAIEWQESTYTVKAGDTLWAISREYCPDTVDTREWIAEVKTLNGMKDSTIHPGQVLIVLAPTK